MLAETLDAGETLRRLTALLVPGQCDWAVVHEATPGGGLRRLACAHRDPARSPLVEALDARGPDGPRVEGTPLARVLQGGEPVVLEGGDEALLAAGGIDAHHLALARALGLRSAVVVPLVSRGRVLGALTLARGDPGRAFTEADLPRVAALGRHAGIALDNARLYESERAERLAAEARAGRLQRLHRLTTGLARAGTAEDAGEALLDALLQERDSAAGAIALLSEDGGTLDVLRTRGYAEGRLAAWSRIPLDAPLPLSESVREARPVLLASRDDLARYPSLARSDADNEAWAVLPLLSEGRAVGGVAVAFRRPRAFPSEDVAFLETLANHAAQAIRRAHEQRRLERQVEERARAEAALRAQKTLYETLLDAQASLGEGVLLVEGDRLAYVNEAIVRMSGYSEEELLRLPVYALAPPDEQERLRALREARLREGRATDRYESHLVHRDGHLVEVEVLVRTLPGNGAPRSMAVMRDVTARKRAEEDLRRSQAWLRGIFDAVDVGLLAVDWPERRIARFNAAAQRIFGYSEEEVLGKGTEILHVDEARFREFGALLADAFRREAPAAFEFQMRRKDGAVFPTEHFVALLRDEAGSTIGGVCLTRDLTARKRQEAELAAARADLAHREKLSALGSLVGGVAHEIRTPLTYLQNNLYLLQARVEEALRLAPPEAGRRVTDAVRQHAQEAVAAADRMDRLVEDLRRFTRLRPGAHAPIDLPAAVAAAVDIFRATHRGRVRVRADLAPTPPVVGDAVQVQQIVLNLLQNAADARPATDAVSVRTRATADGHALLEVEDDGEGIPPEVRAQMFEPFFTTKPHGSGLGLSIVKRIVDEHRALIRCDSEPGRGTRFHVQFPCDATA